MTDNYLETGLEALVDTDLWGFGSSSGDEAQDRALSEAGEPIGITPGQEMMQLGESGVGPAYAIGWPDSLGNTWYERALMAVNDPAKYKRLYQDPEMERFASKMRGRQGIHLELGGRAAGARGKQLSAAAASNPVAENALRYTFSGSTPGDRQRQAEFDAGLTQKVDYRRNQDFMDAVGTARSLDEDGQWADSLITGVFQDALTAGVTQNPSALLGTLGRLGGPSYSQQAYGGSQYDPYGGGTGGYQGALSNQQGVVV